MTLTMVRTKNRSNGFPSRNRNRNRNQNQNQIKNNNNDRAKMTTKKLLVFSVYIIIIYYVYTQIHSSFIIFEVNVGNDNPIVTIRNTTANDYLNIVNDNGYDDKDQTFSACLLWMDDNFRLDEWLAYHFYLLKLRYAVINIDPNSKTSPMDIINRWNNNNYHHINMTIVTMTDTDYIKPKEYEDKINNWLLAQSVPKATTL
jgi:hypothetical protein